MPAEAAAAAPAPAPTAFRAAEKAFQLHREAVPRCGSDPTRRRRGGTRWRVRDVDLGAVLDCGARAAEEAAAGSGSEQPCMPPAPHGGARRGARRVAAPGLPPGCAAYALDERPGAFVVVGALSAAEQAEWAALCLRECPEAPATTNLGGALADAPGLWDAARAGLLLGPGGRGWAPPEAAACDGQQTQAAALLRRLRWASLGAPYDWTARAYPQHAAARPVPRCVAGLAAALAAALGPPDAAPLRGDAALLNYYATGDALGGHVDDAEASCSPLVAFSLGCAAVFLLGGDDVATPPLPLLLRGGDAVLLCGAARRATHGLPRVMTPSDNAPPERAAAAARDALAAVRAAGGDEAQAVAAWMQHTRINISVRDIYSDDSAGPSDTPLASRCWAPHALITHVPIRYEM